MPLIWVGRRDGCQASGNPKDRPVAIRKVAAYKRGRCRWARLGKCLGAEESLLGPRASSATSRQSPTPDCLLRGQTPGDTSRLSASPGGLHDLWGDWSCLPRNLEITEQCSGGTNLDQ
jgi:hypothetical protein